MQVMFKHVKKEHLHMQAHLMFSTSYCLLIACTNCICTSINCHFLRPDVFPYPCNCTLVAHMDGALHLNSEKLLQIVNHFFQSSKVIIQSNY